MADSGPTAAEMGLTPKDMGLKTPEIHRKVDKEKLDGIAQYKKVLSSCFDEKGSFQSEWILKGETSQSRGWSGEHSASDLLHEPVATQVQSVFLGARPLDFIDASQMPERRDAELKRFFDEIDSGVKVYVDERNYNCNAAVYNPDAVRNLIENNKDVFADYEPNKPIDGYLQESLGWVNVVAYDQNPMVLFTNARVSLPTGEVGRVRKVWQKEGEGQELTIAPDVAKQRALKVGLLMGVPRKTLELAISERIKGLDIQYKLTSKHNALFGSSEKYKERIASMRRNDFEQGVTRGVKERILELAIQDGSLYNLGEEELDYINSHIRSHNGYQTADFLYPEFQGRRDNRIESFQGGVLENVFRSGVKDVQNEYAQKYDSLKQKGIGGALRRITKVKSRADRWTQEQIQSVISPKISEGKSA